MRSMSKWMVLAMLALGTAACGGDDDDDGSSGDKGGSGSSTSSSTSKYSCSVNGSCYKCPTSEAVSKCGVDGPGDCTSTDSSYCE